MGQHDQSVGPKNAHVLKNARGPHEPSLVFVSDERRRTAGLGLLRQHDPHMVFAHGHMLAHSQRAHELDTQSFVCATREKQPFPRVGLT